MADTLRDYYEWMRIRLGILTPKEAGIEDAQAGDEPDWQRDPTNYRLKSHIQTACRVVNQFVRLSDVGAYREVPIAAQSADGPYTFDLGGIVGLKDRSLTAIRRAWWNDGTTVTRLEPVILSSLSVLNDPFASSSPGTPRRFAIEGYRAYLDPAPVAAGSFRFMGSCGVLAPQLDTDSFDQIPTDYDPSVLYVALVEYGKSLPADAEMSARAQGFTPDAAAGLERLAAWFNTSNEEAQPQTCFDARWLRRGRLRR